MNFRTPIEINNSPFSIDYQDVMLSMGSCFSDHIGKLLIDSKFNLLNNPFGILYNPVSIANSFTRLLEGNPFSEAELDHDGYLYHSFAHHGSFSAEKIEDCLNRINRSFTNAKNTLEKASVLIVTFGTSRIYRIKDREMAVANCHKYPSSHFDREQLSVDEIVRLWSILMDQLISKTKGLKIIFTVSPIRHLKDGMHQNQLNKSILLLAVDELVKRYPLNACYFPSYEIILDELRDYRFYEADMIHPSMVAIEYIWEKFESLFFTDEAKKIKKEWERLKKSIDHRPLHEQSEKTFLFYESLSDKLKRFQEKNPIIDCKPEIRKIEKRILNRKNEI